MKNYLNTIQTITISNITSLSREILKSTILNSIEFSLSKIKTFFSTYIRKSRDFQVYRLITFTDLTIL